MTTIRATGYRAAFGLALFAALALGIASSQAAPPPSDAQIFANYVKSPSHKTFLTRAFNETEPPVLKAKCAALSIVALDPPLVLQPAEFAQIGTEYIPSIGRWVQRATLNACGAHVIRRLFLVADPQTGDLHAFRMLPGEFPGNLQLEADAQRIVLSGMMRVAKCADSKKVIVLDTKLTSPAAAKGWAEAWTAQVCGRTVTADVVYVTDATGMNVTAKNIKVR
jgi:hypothetical protein